MSKSWESHEKVTKKSWESQENVMRTSWECHEKVMRKSWESQKSHEKVVRHSWVSRETVMRQSWDCHYSIPVAASADMSVLDFSVREESVRSWIVGNMTMVCLLGKSNGKKAQEKFEHIYHNYNKNKPVFFWYKSPPLNKTF